MATTYTTTYYGTGLKVNGTPVQSSQYPVKYNGTVLPSYGFKYNNNYGFITRYTVQNGEYDSSDDVRKDWWWGDDYGFIQDGQPHPSWGESAWFGEFEERSGGKYGVTFRGDAYSNYLYVNSKVTFGYGHSIWLNAHKYKISRNVDGHTWNPGQLYYVVCTGKIAGIPYNATFEQFKNAFGTTNYNTEYASYVDFIITFFTKSLACTNAFETLRIKYGEKAQNPYRYMLPTFDEFRKALDIDVFRMPANLEARYLSNNIAKTITYKGNLDTGEDVKTQTTASNGGYTFQRVQENSYFSAATAGNIVCWRNGAFFRPSTSSIKLYPNNERGWDIISSACTLISGNKFERRTSYLIPTNDTNKKLFPMAKMYGHEQDVYNESSCRVYNGFDVQEWIGVQAASITNCGRLSEYQFRQSISRIYYDRIKYVYNNSISGKTKM